MRRPPGTAPVQAPADAALLHDSPDPDPPGAPRLFLQCGSLTRDRGHYVTHVVGAGFLGNGSVDHPATPERDRVWSVPDAARDGDHIYYPELYL